MIHCLCSDVAQVEISSLGAELMRISHDGLEYLWNGDEAYWQDRSPILFPYVGRLTNGVYQYNGTTYPLDIHGFARSMDFDVRAQSTQSITFALSSNPDIYAMFPFNFLFQVKYTLQHNRLWVVFEVENRDEKTMHFGVGGHPGFTLPLKQGLEFSDYFLDFEYPHLPTRIGHTEACFLSGQDASFPLEQGHILPLCHSMFNQDAIVLKNMARCVTLKTQKDTHYTKVQYEQMPYLGLWHAPHSTAPYICIEPWTSLPSRQDVVEDIALKSDLIHLPAKQMYTNMWSIEVG